MEGGGRMEEEVVTKWWEPLFIYLFFPVSKLPILFWGRARRSHPLLTPTLTFCSLVTFQLMLALPESGCWWFLPFFLLLVGGLSLVMCRVLKPVSIVESLIIVLVSPHCLHKSVDSSAKRKEAREPKMSVAWAAVPMTFGWHSGTGPSAHAPECAFAVGSLSQAALGFVFFFFFLLYWSMFVWHSPLHGVFPFVYFISFLFC